MRDDSYLAKPDPRSLSFLMNKKSRIRKECHSDVHYLISRRPSTGIIPTVAIKYIEEKETEDVVTKVSRKFSNDGLH
jgi:hypothetical protein